MRLSRTPPRRAQAGPVLGADTRAVLREVGYSEDEVDALVASGAVEAR
jgi:formyl-CoA transferase